MARAQLPVSDDRLLAIVWADRGRQSRGWVNGFMARDAYVRSCARGGFYPLLGELPGTTSWTAALKRLEKRGKLRRIELVGTRGAPAGYGFTVL